MAKYKKGQSGNPKGRPQGAKSRAMTSEEIYKHLGKRVQKAYDTIFELMQDDTASHATRLKAAIAFVAEDDKARKRLQDEVEHQLKTKQQELDLEKKKQDLGKPSSSKESDNSTPSAPKVSLKAIK